MSFGRRPTAHAPSTRTNAVAPRALGSVPAALYVVPHPAAAFSASTGRGRGKAPEPSASPSPPPRRVVGPHAGPHEDDYDAAGGEEDSYSTTALLPPETAMPWLVQQWDSSATVPQEGDDDDDDAGGRPRSFSPQRTTLAELPLPCGPHAQRASPVTPPPQPRGLATAAPADKTRPLAQRPRTPPAVAPASAPSPLKRHVATSRSRVAPRDVTGSEDGRGSGSQTPPPPPARNHPGAAATFSEQEGSGSELEADARPNTSVSPLPEPVTYSAMPTPRAPTAVTPPVHRSVVLGGSPVPVPPLSLDQVVDEINLLLSERAALDDRLRQLFGAGHELLVSDEAAPSEGRRRLCVEIRHRESDGGPPPPVVTLRPSEALMGDEEVWNAVIVLDARTDDGPFHAAAVPPAGETDVRGEPSVAAKPTKHGPPHANDMRREDAAQPPSSSSTHLEVAATQSQSHKRREVCGSLQRVALQPLQLPFVRNGVVMALHQVQSHPPDEDGLTDIYLDPSWGEVGDKRALTIIPLGGQRCWGPTPRGGAQP